MNLEKFTDRAKGFLQSAQTVAIGMNHQRISPEHLLKALLEDEQGMASGLIKAARNVMKRPPGVSTQRTSLTSWRIDPRDPPCRNRVRRAERADAMIGLAHPKFRDELARSI